MRVVERGARDDGEQRAPDGEQIAHGVEMEVRSDEWKAHGLECGALDDELTLRGDEARVRGGGVVTLGDGLKARDVKTGAHSEI